MNADKPHKTVYAAASTHPLGATRVAYASGREPNFSQTLHFKPATPLTATPVAVSGIGYLASGYEQR